MKKLFLAWVGQNATTGAPNPLTGRMSKYGTLHVFICEFLIIFFFQYVVDFKIREL